jgi:hypothetical protein
MKNFLQQIKQSNIEVLTLMLFVSVFLATAISYHSVYLFHLLAVAYVFRFFWLFLFRKHKLNLVYGNQLTFVFVFLAYCIAYFSISLIWTPNLIDGLRWVFYYLCTSFIIMFVIQTAKDKKSFEVLYHILLLLIIINAAVGLLETISSFRYPISRLSPYAGLFSYQSLVVQEVLEKTNLSYLFSMPTGFNWNPNNFALIMTVAFPIVLYFKKKTIAVVLSLLIVVLMSLISLIRILSKKFTRDIFKAKTN